MTVNSNPYSVVAIGNTALRLLSFQGQPVITLSMMDQAHERPEGTAGRNFRENKERLVEGEDYFRRISSEAKTEFDITAPNGLTLLTQSGYLMLVKSFTDDLSWKVQRQLVDGYFGYRKPKEPTIAQQMAVHKMRLSLLDRLQRETHPEKREAIHQQLAHVSRLLNLPTPDKDKIGGDADPHRRRLPAGSPRSPVPSLAVWAGECLTPETGHWTHIGTAASNADTHLYPHYLRWCRASGDESMTLRRFRAELVATLRAAGPEVIETRRETGQGLQGIRIKSDATPGDMFGADTGLNTS